MVAGQRVRSRTKLRSHPGLRFVQLAAYLRTNEFIFENMVRSRTVEGLHVLFRAEASQYWSTHFIPGRRSEDMPKRIGHFKRNLLGINLAVPMIFAYGDYVGDEVLKDHAVELLEKITCESNTIVDAWRQGGVPMESAVDSQAILQLNNEFCARRVCWKCPVGKRVIRGARGSSVLREL